MLYLGAGLAVQRFLLLARGGGLLGELTLAVLASLRRRSLVLGTVPAVPVLLLAHPARDVGRRGNVELREFVIGSAGGVLSCPARGAGGAVGW